MIRKFYDMMPIHGDEVKSYRDIDGDWIEGKIDFKESAIELLAIVKQQEKRIKELESLIPATETN